MPVRTTLVASLAALCVGGVLALQGAALAAAPYEFQGGFPTEATLKRAYDDADLNRAIQAYRFFYPNVSMYALLAGIEAMGGRYNQTAVVFEARPHHVFLTPNSDTPYFGLPVDLSAGPVVVELPKGPLLGVVNDLNFRWVADLGLPGPDAGAGGKHLILPPGFTGPVPEGYHVSRSTTNRLLLMARSLPVGGDVAGAIERLKTVKVHPLDRPDAQISYVEATDRPVDGTPGKWEGNLQFWKVLHDVIDTEPMYEPMRNNYGELAALGIAKGKPFAPDARMTRILEEAARQGVAQMKVQSLADRRADRVAWSDRQWEWAALRPEIERLGKQDGTIDLYFGPKAPSGKEGQWIRTVPGKGWFTYFRIYGPQQASFDGSWRPGDFEEVR